MSMQGTALVAAVVAGGGTMLLATWAAEKRNEGKGPPSGLVSSSTHSCFTTKHEPHLSCFHNLVNCDLTPRLGPRGTSRTRGRTRARPILRARGRPSGLSTRALRRTPREERRRSSLRLPPLTLRGTEEERALALAPASQSVALRGATAREPQPPVLGRRFPP